MSTRNPIHRRTLLKGLGASLALPWLDIMQPSRVLAGLGQAANKPPVRMAFIYTPNGKHLPDWFSPNPGVLVDLPPTLQPLNFAREDMLLFSGLTHNNALPNGNSQHDDHAAGCGTFLTGAQTQQGSPESYVGISVDQFAAQAIGHETRLPSLELGIDRFRGGNAYMSNISWKSPTTPAPYENNPKLIFDRMFTNGDSPRARRAAAERDFYRKSVLDAVSDDARKLEKQLGHEDRRKVDQYLTSVREIERRIEESAETVVIPASQFPRPEGIPHDITEHVQMIGDLIVLAYQTDSTRVSSLIIDREANNRSYPFLGFSDGHHDLSHHGGEPEKHKKLRKVDQYHVSLLAYLAERMKATPEGEGTLLDNSMILYGSGLSDGDRHDHVNLPVVVVGRGGGKLKTGQNIICRTETPLCNVFLSMLQAAGVKTDYFADSTGPLKEMFV